MDLARWENVFAVSLAASFVARVSEIWPSTWKIGLEVALEAAEATCDDPRIAWNQSSEGTNKAGDKSRCFLVSLYFRLPEKDKRRKEHDRRRSLLPARKDKKVDKSVPAFPDGTGRWILR